MDKKNIDWANLGFGYIQTDKRFVSNFKDGKWDDGKLTDSFRRNESLHHRGWTYSNIPS